MRLPWQHQFDSLQPLFLLSPSVFFAVRCLSSVAVARAALNRRLEKLLFFFFQVFFQFLSASGAISPTQCEADARPVSPRPAQPSEVKVPETLFS